MEYGFSEGTVSRPLSAQNAANCVTPATINSKTINGIVTDKSSEPAPAGTSTRMPTISSLFSPEPIQWGLRGDPYLWREMAEHFQLSPLPESAEELSTILEHAFHELTGHTLTHPTHFGLARHAHGGMSSGGIAPLFWRERGIPLLLSRFMAQHSVKPR